MFFKDAYLADFTKNTKDKNQVIVFFHGFPGRTTRNEDLASMTHESLSCDTFALHYPGLGKSEGEFSFTMCIERGDELLHKFSKEYKKIHVVGHSWGGFVATYCYANLKNKLKGELVLINPLLELFSREVISQFIESSLDDPKLEWSHKNDPSFTTRLLEDSETLRNSESALQILKKMNLKIITPHLLLASADKIVPAQITLNQVENTDLKIYQWEGDHWFNDSRQKVANLITQVIEKESRD